MDGLPTCDILNKEILSTGRLFGQGSALGGDLYTAEDLDAMVAAASAIPSLRRPFKLGHNPEQKLIAADGWPAIGWVENLRRMGETLLGDIRNVPQKLGQLIEAGAYRCLSPELVWNYTDADGTVYDRVLTGLALLGADIPACTNLDDFVTLYGAPAGTARVYGGESGELHVYDTAATPVVDSDGFTAADFAYTPNTKAPGSWKLRLVKTPGGDPDPGIVGAACAALGKGFRGQKVDIPEADLSAVKAKVAAAWKKANPDKDPKTDMPEVLKEMSAEEGDLHTLAIMLPLSEKGSYEWTREQIEEALPKSAGLGPYWWVEKTYPSFAVVDKCADTALPRPTDRSEWIIPYAITPDGVVTLAPETEWQEVEEQELFIAAKAYAGAQSAADPDLLDKFSALMDEMEGLIKGKTGSPKLRMWMQEAHGKLTAIVKQQAPKDAGEKGAPASSLTTNQGDTDMNKDICLALGLAEDAPDADVLARVQEINLAAKPADLRAYVATESPEYKTLQADAAEGKKAAATLHQMQRESVLDPAMQDGKFLAAELADWERHYDLDPDGTAKILAGIASTVLNQEVGSGAGGRERKDLSKDRKAAKDEAKAYQTSHPGTTFAQALDALEAELGK